MTTNQPQTIRRGATLLELLAVIVIMLMITATAIPVLAPAMANRQVREATRIVSSFITGARNRAMQNGRPVGVVLERMPGLPEACVTLSYAEVPAPYSGDYAQSVAVVSGTNISGLGIYDRSMGAILSNDAGWSATVRVGDLIKFGYQGHVYRLTGPAAAIDPTTGYYMVDPSTTNWTMTPINGNSYTPPIPPAPPTIAAYQIIRSPVKLAAGSVQLPGQTVIDLTASGFDNDDTSFPNTEPFIRHWSFRPTNDTDASNIMIMFAPSGAVDGVWSWNAAYPAGSMVFAKYNPLSAIHLLIGRRDRLPLLPVAAQQFDPTLTDSKPDYNWQDLNNSWVSISYLTGQVITAEMAPYDPTSSTPVLQSRKYAHEAQRIGGRR